MGIAFDITASDTTVTHGLGTRDILVQAWQNNYLVQPDVAQRDDNTLRVFAIGASETNPIRLIIFPIGTGYSDPTEPNKPSSIKEIDTKEESSASKANNPKARRNTKSKAS